MAEPAFQYETKEVETKALSVVDQAKLVKVTDPETYVAAGQLYKSIGDMIKEVKETFDPICDAANRAHKEATAKRAKFLDPLQSAYRSVKGLMADYDAEQERIRLAEQRRLEEEVRKRAEEQALLEAIAAEEEAKRNGATKEEAEQEAAAIMEEPVYVPPVIVPRAIPKIQGVSYQERWSAQVFDIIALCKAVGDKRVSPECVMGLAKDKATGVISCPSLNTLATSQKATLAIPGVRAVSRRV